MKLSYIFASTLYMLQKRTGFISGQDLHEVFIDLCKGEPSPSGKYKIPIEKFRSHSVCSLVKNEVSSRKLYQEHLKKMGYDPSPEKSYHLYYLCRTSCGLKNY